MHNYSTSPRTLSPPRSSPSNPLTSSYAPTPASLHPHDLQASHLQSSHNSTYPPAPLDQSASAADARLQGSHSSSSSTSTASTTPHQKSSNLSSHVASQVANHLTSLNGSAPGLHAYNATSLPRSISPPQTTPSTTFSVPTTNLLPSSTLQRALLARNSESSRCWGSSDPRSMAYARRKFGLSRWREYAVLRHGNNVAFQTSKHGREMIQSEAVRQNEEDVGGLERREGVLEGEVRELGRRLESEKLAKKETETRVLQMEGELRQYRDDPAMSVTIDELYEHERLRSISVEEGLQNLEIKVRERQADICVLGWVTTFESAPCSAPLCSHRVSGRFGSRKMRELVLVAWAEAAFFGI